MTDNYRYKILDGTIAQIVDDDIEMDVIQVPDLSSLYLPTPEVSKFIGDLDFSVSNTQKLNKKVVLHIIGSRADDLTCFVSHKPSFIRYEVVEHILELRALFRRIFDQSDRFILITDGDLLGSWFELSLLCGRVIVLNHLARVGFSQLAYGFLPALGALELLNYFSKGYGKSLWEKGFLWNVLDIPSKFSFEVIPIGKSKIALENIIGFRTETKSLTISLRSSRGLPFKGDWVSTKNLRKKYAEILWESYWEDFDETEFFKFSDLEIVLGSWFEASEHSVLAFSASSLYSSTSTTSLQVSHLNKIWIDVTHYLPPFKLILLWSQTDIEMVFCSGDQYKLLLSVKKIYEKLSNVTDKKDLKKLWDNNVSWAVTQDHQLWDSDKKILSFISDGSVECSDAKAKFRFVRLATNEFNSKIGTAELALDKVSFFDTELDAKIWAQGVVFRRLIKTNSLDLLGMPASQWLRACFLEEVAKEASNSKNNFKELFKWLASEGWGLVADESWWSSHLLSRFSNWPVQNGNKIFTELGPHEDFRDLSGWNQILKLVKSKTYPLHGGRLSPQRTVPSLFSEHLLIFSTILGLKLLEFGVVNSFVEVDLIVRFSLEVPPRYGSPVGFIRRLGPEHIREYAENFFPGRNFTGAIESLFDDSGSMIKNHLR